MSSAGVRRKRGRQWCGKTRLKEVVVAVRLVKSGPMSHHTRKSWPCCKQELATAGHDGVESDLFRRHAPRQGCENRMVALRLLATLQAGTNCTIFEGLQEQTQNHG